MRRVPDFDELIGDEALTESERERLRLVHDLLVRAGPPAELPPALVQPPKTGARVTVLPRRRRMAALMVAAALLAVSFGIGYLVADHGKGAPAAAFSVRMHGTALAPHAVASIHVFAKDKADNWPMVLKVNGLARLPNGGLYVLYLTKAGKLGPACGTFRVHAGTTNVRLNAPYKLRHYDGWVVTRRLLGHARSGERLLTT